MIDESRPVPARWAVSRRTFVSILGAIGVAGVVGNGLGRLVRFRSATPAADEPLTARELATLTALGHVLLPSRLSAKGAAVDGIVADIVRRQIAATPTALADFRAAAEFLDREALTDRGVAFAALESADRERTVAALLTPYTTRRFFSEPYYRFAETGRQVRRLWMAVARPIIVGFYDSPDGWQVVGYSRRPGECSNLIDYQFPIA